jgi:hypothetical protein
VQFNQGLRQVLSKLVMVEVLGVFWLRGIPLHQYCLLHRHQWASGTECCSIDWSLSRNWLVNLEGKNRVVGGLQDMGHDDLESLAI